MSRYLKSTNYPTPESARHPSPHKARKYSCKTSGTCIAANPISHPLKNFTRHHVERTRARPSSTRGRRRGTWCRAPCPAEIAPGPVPCILGTGSPQVLGRPAVPQPREASAHTSASPSASSPARGPAAGREPAPERPALSAWAAHDCRGIAASTSGTGARSSACTPCSRTSGSSSLAGTPTADACRTQDVGR